MSFQWQSFMEGRTQDREIRKFLDSVAPQIGAFRGAPADVVFDTTRSIITTWPTTLEAGVFDGKTDASLGEITIPADGAYAVSATLTGVLTGGAASGEGIAYIRSSLTGDLPVQAGPVILGTLRAGFSFATWGQFTENEVLSLALDATANLGTLTFASGSFEVIARDV